MVRVSRMAMSRCSSFVARPYTCIYIFGIFCGPFSSWSVCGSAVAAPARLRGPSSLLKLEGCPQPLGTWLRGGSERCSPGKAAS